MMARPCFEQLPDLGDQCEGHCGVRKGLQLGGELGKPEGEGEGKLVSGQILDLAARKPLR